ncbi:MAG: hypothetical protein LBB24_01675 [Rickettsiales bacterium]|jgi:hypothetical protein|nr:hypothetical protein [Rickettsiales bacterium]
MKLGLKLRDSLPIVTLCIGALVLHCTGDGGIALGKSDVDNAIASTERNYPRIEGSIFFKYSFDSLLDDNDGRDDDRRMKSLMEVYENSRFYFTENFLLYANIALRPVSPRENHGDEGYTQRKHYFFRGYGLLVEEIDIEYREERFLFGVGKFNPTFSYALKNKYYGIDGTRILSSYQLYEKVGFYTAMILPMLTARINFFRNDTTFLSNSLINDRGRYNLENDIGNVPNILENFSITVDFPVLDNNKFNFGFRKLATKDSNKKSEFGFVAGLECLFEETRETLGAAPAIEFVALHNYGGETANNTFFILANMPFFYDKWNFGLAWSGKIFKGDRWKVSQIFQGSIDYTFQNGLAIDFSRKYEVGHHSNSDGKIQKDKFSSWGVGLSYLLKFE